MEYLQFLRVTDVHLLHPSSILRNPTLQKEMSSEIMISRRNSIYAEAILLAFSKS